MTTPLAPDPGRNNHALRPVAAPRILVFTTLFPNPAQPRLGVFVRDRVLAVAKHCPTVVVAPIHSRLLLRLDQGLGASVPMEEDNGSLRVLHPRFTTLPGIGRATDPVLLYWQALGAVRRLRREFTFDLIDAHYAFPDGATAVMLGRYFRVPVCITMRGGDIDLLTRFRLRREVIRRTLRAATQLFAVSEHLARGAAALGVPRERIQVVPNGIDVGKFSPKAQDEARESLGIDPGQRLLLCVGNLLAEKGQHVLIEALGLLSAEDGRDVHAVIIGSDQWGRHTYTEQLRHRIEELGLSERVRLVGSVPQSALGAWYSAANLLVLPTFREGCPNVVREALACGTPVVASRVGGVPELVTSDTVGLLVEPGDTAALANAIRAGLRRRWDRAAIAAFGGQRTWPVVAAEVAEHLRDVVGGAEGKGKKGAPVQQKPENVRLETGP